MTLTPIDPVTGELDPTALRSAFGAFPSGVVAVAALLARTDRWG